ncbi:Hexapeptide repeat of succinyl-transferase [Reichenbachiella faecimaris]|uniref:Hexapeptide repeat of succinyl-transferase n=1 Tax=Reichenbachiella faecimaris TaxID=692418 RepID=A0A1W2GIT1_REIFA|nr:DapH/DapD/GlmU-related protein [Reichenbachiella faecimaris]SMD36481.1 Hexapeptide repeat of succinyl-transferase [Reichenbachiella faecimaris]
MKKGFKWLLYRIVNKLLSIHRQYTNENIYRAFDIHPSVQFWNVSFEGNIIIAEKTYINEGSRIDSGSSSTVKIGSHCAIGRYVHITSKTHSLDQPTTSRTNSEIKIIEKNTTIGNHVWIGDKSFINLGVSIGDNAIIGANSVVLKDVLPYEVVAGVPAKHIKFNRPTGSK